MYIRSTKNSYYKLPQQFSVPGHNKHASVDSSYFGRSEFAIMHWNKSMEIAIGLRMCMLVLLALRASSHCSPKHNQPTTLTKFIIKIITEPKYG